MAQGSDPYKTPSIPMPKLTPGKTKSPVTRPTKIVNPPAQQRTSMGAGMGRSHSASTGSNSGNSGGYSSSGSGGGGSDESLTWRVGYSLSDAPTWWKGMIASKSDANTEYAMMLNSLIPYLSPEDQRQVAVNLSALYPDAFGMYSPEQETYPGTPTEITTDLKNKFTSSARAQNMLTALDTMRQATGKAVGDMGPGYTYLRQIASTMGQFGGGASGGQTRRQVLEMYAALDPLLAQSGSDTLSAYSEIGRAMTQPYFTAGSVIPVSKDSNGQWVFSGQNKKWY